MPTAWTQEQKRVIDVRDKDVLVSAAAGSGKTAVLVERIISRITDPVNPVDIDRLLVVTFTNAAAAEMRERIRDALEQRVQEEPDNVHLQKQIVLVHHASITTIHSFCLQVLRSHFHTIGLDPGFRIADEGECRLLEQDTAEEILEEAYEQREPEFHEFLECLATGKNDSLIGELILQLHHFSLAHPWPGEWLDECCRMYEAVLEDGGKDGQEPWEGPAPEGSGEDGQDPCGGLSESGGKDGKREEIPEPHGGSARGKDGKTEAAAWEELPWMEFLTQDIRRILEDMLEELEEAARLAQEPDGPYPYLQALESDRQLLCALLEARGYEAMAQAFGGMGSFARLPAVRDKSVSGEKKQQVQEIRSRVKKEIGDIRGRYFYADPGTLQREFYESGKIVRMLVRLTKRFGERLAQKKAEKNQLDFSDLEHFALDILLVKKDGKAVPSQAAREYAEVFEEIMIDEYQDSNLVQEMILNSVAGAGCGRHNRFMVGDVKQSIYRFRLARPELFMEKYQTYADPEDESCCRIDLHKNFRSRPQVLDGVNYIFRQIMTKELGGIAYDADAALYPGASFLPGADPQFLPVEILLLEGNQGSRPAAKRQEEEAELAGRRILEIVGREKVWDKELDAYRPAAWRDIVILLRTVSGWAETFRDVLSDMGIPCFAGTRTGYFSAAEVRIVLSYLQILDNPVQDIPLAAVMRSAIGGFTDEELAVIRARTQEYHYYDCCREFSELYKESAGGPEAGICRKLESFFDTYERLRAKTTYTPVHLLLWEILDVTGYGAYAAALPAGEQRKANLDMLVEKAIAYEASSYRGLYHFVRYIESLKKYEVDYGEAGVVGEAQDAVRIMSIHKSKGLEFPIVFVSGISKNFNVTDVRGRVALHPDLGIGCDCVDPERRLRTPSLLKKVIQRRIVQENLGEELRVLYVAMTRAKEKLILTGTADDLDGELNRHMPVCKRREEKLSYARLLSASSYLDWILPAMLRHPDAACWRGGAEFQELSAGSGARFQCVRTAPCRQEMRRLAWENAGSLRLEKLMGLDLSVVQDRQAADYLARTFKAEYPYEKDREICGKVSVSELKRMSQEADDEAEQLYEKEEAVPLIPAFRGEGAAFGGAARGTVYHVFMQNLDLSMKEPVEIQLEELIKCGKMTREEGNALDPDDIGRFLASDVAERMSRAAERGMLFREQQFVMGVPADSIRSGWNPRETVLVQGIIDAFFYEEDGDIVLLDYKTDHVRSWRTLEEKYRPQLACYAAALERITGHRVKRQVIYSFCLGREIVL